jgi:hypothetical protein
MHYLKANRVPVLIAAFAVLLPLYWQESPGYGSFLPPQMGSAKKKGLSNTTGLKGIHPERA